MNVESSGREIEEIERQASDTSVEALSNLPSFDEHIERLEKYKLKLNTEVQQLYDDYRDHSRRKTKQVLREFNESLSNPYLASGMSSYFNEQVEQNGLNELGLTPADAEDAKYISRHFGKETHFGEHGIPILYMASLGTAELNYAEQDFPAGVFEDVFQCPADHSLPLNPKVGEKEVDFYERILKYQIDERGGIESDTEKEMLSRGRRLAEHFCKGKNRVYLLPLSDLMQQPASFGDIIGLRDGSQPEMISEARPLAEIMAEKGLKTADIFTHLDFTSEHGVAFYGRIENPNIDYIEVERHYDRMQRQARELGMKEGEDIDTEVLNRVNDNLGYLLQTLDFPKLEAEEDDPEGLMAARNEDKIENRAQEAELQTKRVQLREFWRLQAHSAERQDRIQELERELRRYRKSFSGRLAKFLKRDNQQETQWQKEIEELQAEQNRYLELEALGWGEVQDADLQYKESHQHEYKFLRQFEDPFSDHEKEDYLAAPVLARLSTKDYLRLWRRLGSDYTVHEVNQELGDKNGSGAFCVFPTDVINQQQKANQDKPISINAGLLFLPHDSSWQKHFDRHSESQPTHVVYYKGDFELALKNLMEENGIAE